MDHPTPAQPPMPRPAAPAGFTLIELLVVIVIVAALIAITLSVGRGVVEGQRTRLAQDRIRVVDIAIDSFTRDTGASLPPIIRVPSPVPGLGNDPTEDALIPLADAAVFNGVSSEEDRTIINTVGLLGRALDDAGLSDLLRSLEGEALEFLDPDNDLTNAQPELRTVVDPWGRPLRVVHPRFDGVIREVPKAAPGDPGAPVLITAAAPRFALVTEDDLPDEFDATVFGGANFPIDLIRRNRVTDADRGADDTLIGDADGGVCPSNSPYVYSAGVDGDPATIDDNAYTDRPNFSAD